MYLTLMHVIILVTGIAAAAWLVIGYSMRVSQRASQHFFLANLMAATGVLLISERSDVPSYLFYQGGSCALLASFAFYYSGICYLLKQTDHLAIKVWGALLLNAGIVVTLPPNADSYIVLGMAFSIFGTWFSANSLRACYLGLSPIQPEKIRRLAICSPFIVAMLGMFYRTLDLANDYFFATVPHRVNAMTPNTELQYWWLILAYLISLNTIIQVLTATRLVMKMRHLAERDFLTGCLNRRSTETVFNLNIERKRRFGGQLSCVMFDLDRFKSINDQHGHEGGDRALKHAAQITEKLIRKVDALGRYGGEEFLLLLPETEKAGAVRTAERIRQALEETPLMFEGKTIAVRASFGVAVLGDDERYEDLVKRADLAMYQAKHLGRNRVEVAQEMAATPEVISEAPKRTVTASRIPLAKTRKQATEA